MDQPLALSLLSVNVGTIEVIGGDEIDAEIRSGIRKRPVAGTVSVTALGIVGDEQADTRKLHGVQVHGGPEKAVYAYSAEHFPWWAEELGQEIEPAAFGENLTIGDIAEDTAAIGDVWRWGTVVLQITEPRGPCYKLGIHRGTTRVIEAMNETNRTGWYLRVLEAGEAPATGTIDVVERHAEAVTVAHARAVFQRRREDELCELLELEPLGADMKQQLRNALARL